MSNYKWNDAIFGDLEPVSGVVSLLKSIAILQHRKIPRQVNLEKLSDDIRKVKQHIEIPIETVSLPDSGALYCGLSSFGFTGTNTHVILKSGDSGAGNFNFREGDTTKSAWPDQCSWSNSK